MLEYLQIIHFNQLLMFSLKKSKNKNGHVPPPPLWTWPVKRPQRTPPPPPPEKEFWPKVGTSPPPPKIAKRPHWKISWVKDDDGKSRPSWEQRKWKVAGIPAVTKRESLGQWGSLETQQPRPPLGNPWHSQCGAKGGRTPLSAGEQVPLPQVLKCAIVNNWNNDQAR